MLSGCFDTRGPEFDGKVGFKINPPPDWEVEVSNNNTGFTDVSFRTSQNDSFSLFCGDYSDFYR